MAQGNPNKVNAIVDEIVENNNVFKSKSPTEQDKEKDSIAQSINSAISVLNEVGKELVLQELSVDPDEKFKGFIDSVGNVDISGLSKMTATIVKEKIIEAEKEGINLRQGQPVFKDNTKALLVEGVLTVAVIDTMIKNYDNLSNEDIQSLINEYDSMPPEYQDAFNKAQANMLNKIADGIEDKNTRDAVRNQAHNTEHLRKRNKDEKDSFNRALEKPQIVIAMYHDLSKAIYKLKNINENVETINLYKKLGKLFNINNGENLESVLSKFSPEELNQVFANLQTLRDEIVHQTNETQKTKTKTNQEMTLCATIVNSLTNGWEKLFPGITIESMSATHIKDKIQKASLNINSPIEMDTNKENTVSQEIEQISSALVTKGFSSKEEISGALKIYKGTLESLENDDIELLSSGTIDTEKLLKKYLIEDGISQENAEILSKIDYNGQLFEILADETKRKDFFEQLEQVIEPKKEQEIQDEHTDDYYNSQNETLQVDEIAEKVAQEVQARGGSLEEITEELVKKAKEQVNEQHQTISEEQLKEPKLSEQSSPVEETKIAPEEHTQETVTSPEQEISEETSQNMAMVEQDNSFIGKIKRVFANMKDMKNKDTSKGFFARLGASIQTVFGNKKEEFYTEQDEISTYAKTEDKIQPRTNPKQIDYLNQHFEVNTQEAIKKTEENKKAKEFLSTEDKTADKEEK